ncbi:MAG TPA: phospho-N-acetylmuramoyl-pentapeptide-transferase [Clostridiaceae bacterium]|nr:phospho-N-acetylmuramoyl-pentapeptide-transferase [Clostridiaceae bacterium]
MYFSAQAKAFALTFALALVVGPIIIPILRKLKFGQTVRDDGPSTHLRKKGTPTMGGIIFLIPIIIVASIYYFEYPQMLPLVFVTVGFGLVGFIDDFIKVTRKRKDGLNPSQKMLGLFAVSTVFVAYVSFNPELGTDIILPFYGLEHTLELPVWIFIPFNILVLLTMTNAVNLTDGVDGLAAGITLIVMVFFAIITMAFPGWSYVKMFSSIVAGGCLGFLIFNKYPARVFMGDTGSLALGGAVGTVAVITKMPWVLLLVGIVYLVETASVIIQVVSFKTRGKRIFKMAPLHHHFELLGWKETKVVGVFWTVTVIFCIIALTALRIMF